VAVSSAVAANSPQQLPVSFTVASPAPGAPTGLTANAVSSSRIDLAWTAGTGTTQWYLIERRLADGGSFAVIDSVPGGMLSYASTGLEAETGYAYRVQGCTSGYCSVPSNEATATTQAAPAPLLAVSPEEVSFTGVQNGATPGDRTVSITNAGTGSLTGLSAAVTYGAGQPTGWLSASLSGTTAPASLILSANQAGLVPGTYTATVAVASPVAANSPATIAVTLTVTEAQPAIGLAPTVVAFAATAGGANPASQAVAVTNAGNGGTLSGLSVAVTYGAEQPAGWLEAVLSGTTAPTTLTLTAMTGSLTPGSYSATVAVSSAVAANSPQQVQVSFTVANPAPGAPTGLTANAVSSSRIDLAWTAGTGTTQWYRIERRLADGGSFAVIDSVPGGTLSYASTGLEAATGYAYRVQGCTSGYCSGWSNEATATTAADDPTAPNVPGNVTGVRVSPTQIRISWTAPGGQTHYVLRRRQTGAGGAWTFETTIPGNATEYLDEGLTAGATYQYQIRACSAAGCSDYSGTVSVGS
jgi:hypothetical protein